MKIKFRVHRPYGLSLATPIITRISETYVDKESDKIEQYIRDTGIDRYTAELTYELAKFDRRLSITSNNRTGTTYRYNVSVYTNMDNIVMYDIWPDYIFKAEDVSVEIYGANNTNFYCATNFHCTQKIDDMMKYISGVIFSYIETCKAKEDEDKIENTIKKILELYRYDIERLVKSELQSDLYRISFDPPKYRQVIDSYGVGTDRLIIHIPIRVDKIYTTPSPTKHSESDNEDKHGEIIPSVDLSLVNTKDTETLEEYRARMARLHKQEAAVKISNEPLPETTEPPQVPEGETIKVTNHTLIADKWFNEMTEKMKDDKPSREELLKPIEEHKDLDIDYGKLADAILERIEAKKESFGSFDGFK